MNLRKQFEKETSVSRIHDGELLYHRQYVYWLEDKLNIYENAEEIITNKKGLFIRDEKHRMVIDKLEAKNKE